MTESQGKAANPSDPNGRIAAALATQVGGQPLIAVLTPVPSRKAIRPPTPDAMPLVPKPSAAPPPRLIPAAAAPRQEASSVQRLDAPVSVPAAQSPILIIGLAPPEKAPASPAAPSAADEIAEILSHEPGHEGSATPELAGTAAVTTAQPETAPALPHRHDHTGEPAPLRRTMIPIFFTLGLMLGATGVDLLVNRADEDLAALLPRWSPTVLIVFAGILLLVALANIVSVRRILPPAQFAPKATDQSSLESGSIGEAEQY